MSRWLEVFAVLALLGAVAVADTPANCMYEDIIGEWTIYETPRGVKPGSTCSGNQAGPWQRKIRITLLSPNKVVDQFGNEGTWTMVYNQGFSFEVNGRSYFGFSAYKQEGSEVTSFCHRTIPSLSHDVNVRHWACFYAQKVGAHIAKKHQDPFHPKNLKATHMTKETHERIVAAVNSQANAWRAELHQPFVNLRPEELLRLRGGKRSWGGRRPSPAPVTLEQIRADAQLPPAFDWRNVDGVNYVSPVRNQKSCGSCYAFSSAGMIENRIRIKSNNTITTVLSPQDVVSCSNLAQGCDGGFPFLIAGRYSQDYGLVDENCAPYTGKDSSCPRENCDRIYSSSYRYVGGYYGGCNELAMKQALVKGGPLSVSFEALDDFMHYKTGVYHHTSVSREMALPNPFEETNHAVLLVGYGVDEESGDKFWIVKNSWGEDWGESGYFRIRRGTDEVGIESLAVEAEPIPY